MIVLLTPLGCMASKLILLTFFILKEWNILND